MSQAETPKPVFRLHLPVEPHSLDPAKLTSSDTSYFFGNVMRGLYRYSTSEGLKPEGAESCRFETPLKLVCHLASDSFWSDGSAVTAADYERSFRRLSASNQRAPTVELLRKLKNAKAVRLGEKKPEELGVHAEGADKLVIEFEEPDPEFLYKLTANALVPVKTEAYPGPGEIKGILFNGPYVVTGWMKNHRIRLEPNSFYKRGRPDRPPVEVLFIDEDQTALNLYEKGELSFLRRLPTTYIPKYRDRKDFHQIPIARFDYVGFGEELRAQPELRAALSFAADYKELQKLYDALGTPGCPGLSPEFFDQERCVKFDLKRAKEHWAKVPAEMKKRRYQLFFSRLGGDDIRKGMEWFQAQWKKNLGVQVDLQASEQGVYLARLREDPPAIYRKGVGLERPTCLAALETFASGGTDNFLKIQDPAYDSFVAKLSSLAKPGAEVRVPSPEARKVCGEGLQMLLDHHWLIPLGQIHFTMLASPLFEGWSLNEMNQLDLAQLHALPAKP